VKYEKTVDYQRPRKMRIYWESHEGRAITLASLKKRIESVYVCSRTEQNPDHAGEQYISLAATVARKTSYSEVADMPCVRKIRRAYSKPEHDDRTLVTCSVMA